MSGKFEQEFNVSHSQFLQGMTEMMKITTDILETFKKAYAETQDPFAKIEMEKYAEALVSLVRLLKSYTIRVENGIGVLPIVLFSDGRASFGYRMKDEVDLSNRWFKEIAKKHNGREMVI